MRTPEEIRKNIYVACGSEYISTSRRIAKLQEDLIQALIWDECPPDEGWEAARDRQATALQAMTERSNDNEPFSFFKFPDPPAKDIAYDIRENFDAMKPWNVRLIDEFIDNGKFPIGTIGYGL